MIGALILALALPQEAPVTTAESRVAMAGYAACVVSRKGPAVEALLARPYDDLVSKASRALYEPTCPLATGTTVYRTNILRGYEGLAFRSVLFQALVTRDRSRLAAVKTLTFPGEAAFPSGRMWPGSPAADYLRYIGMGECVVKRDVVNARALVLTDPETAEERAVATAIATTFGKCGWSMKALTLARGAVSEILYRAAAPAGVQ